MPRQKEKLEIDALKTSLNLKNLELESISGEYEEAQKIIASSERKIADLESMSAFWNEDWKRNVNR